MAHEFPVITTKQYTVEVTKWLTAIKRGEDACVLFFPKTDRDIRLGQLLNDAEITKRVFGSNTTHLYLRVDFEAHNVEDSEDFSFQIEERLNLLKITPESMTFEKWMKYLRKKGITLILILPEAEKYLTTEGKIALSIISYVIKNYTPIIRILSFFETNITHSSILPILPSSSWLYENIFHYPLYSEAETKRFMILIARQWSLTLDSKKESKILHECGGHFWLVKEALRRLAAGEDWSSDHEGMLFRLRSVYNLMLPSEQEIVEKIVTGRSDVSPEEQLSLDYLMKMRVISPEKELLIGAFKNFILHKSDTTSYNLNLKDNRVYLNNITVHKIFSRKEYRALKLLVAKKNQIVTRDEIGKSLWQDDTEYSDWAIDQLICRLRKRFMELSLSPKIIRSVRGKGYILEMSA
ncbi:winged helix-turn-helix transcriptional regulator [Candidatus Gottesmanbacteria bacterium]|nr:winged helix-turn-helix transcriptional regulator [Candidatus Gottesmanbacteria bacterium]